MSEKKGKVKVLADEISSVKNYMKYRSYLPLPKPGGRKKNTYDSVKYREKANALFKSKIHNEKIHEQIWRTYTQSIALAPNDSEELAYGYWNRATLWYHLKNYKDCIKDCDRALSATKSDVFKLKLLTRKAECLLLSNKPEAEDVCEEAKQFLENLHLDDGAAKVWDEKLEDISSASSMINVQDKDDKKLRKKYKKDLSSFARSEEVPCASKSVEIKYNKKLGRHIVATDDIKPAEIFAIEKNYYTYISRDGMYLYCSNCAKPALSSIPCEHCIFDVYCSESCRTEAWNKYHQWECAVFPHLWDIDENVEVCLFVMRFTFKAISDAGGLDNMKKLLSEIDECNDRRTRGFTDGVFHDDSVKSIYSLTWHRADSFIENEFIQQFCIDAYLVAKYTDFFGYKMHMSVAEIFENKDVLFLAALLHHSHHITHFNAHHLSYKKNDEEARYATTVRAFTSLLNHDCDPNVNLFLTKDNTTVLYATKPIKKGAQLVINYCNLSFLQQPREERRELLQRVYHFTCKCLACTGNWTSASLPNVQIIDALTPELHQTILEIIDNTSKFKKFKKEKNFCYSPKIMQDFVYFLESMAKKVNTHCDLYESCVSCLDNMFWDVFGSFYFTLLDKCCTS